MMIKDKSIKKDQKNKDSILLLQWLIMPIKNWQDHPWSELMSKTLLFLVYYNRNIQQLAEENLSFTSSNYNYFVLPPHVQAKLTLILSPNHQFQHFSFSSLHSAALSKLHVCAALPAFNESNKCTHYVATIYFNER